MSESHRRCAPVEDKYRPAHHPWVNNKPLPQEWTQVKECNIEKRQRSMAECVHMMNHMRKVDRSLGSGASQVATDITYECLMMHLYLFKIVREMVHVHLLNIYPHPVVTAIQEQRHQEAEG